MSVNKNYPGNQMQTQLQNILNRNSSIMSSTYPTLTKTGLWYTEGFSDSSDLTSSMNDIVNSINENLAQLDFIQTNINSANNLNQEALIKQGELLKLKNEELKKQLQNLEIIQFNINNKERLIDQTQLNTEKNEVNIYLLVVAMILAFILIFFIVLYGNGKINGKKLFLVLIIIASIYGMIYIFTFNVFAFRDAMTYLSSSKSNWYLGKALKKWDAPIYNYFNEKEQDAKNNWIANNCNCPPEEESVGVEEQEEYIQGIGGTRFQKEVPGYYYQDHSSPAQLVVPLPTQVKNLNQKIDWVDYSANGNMKYLSNINQNIYNDNQYYNYKPAKTQAQKMLFELNNNGALVGNSTKTGNI